MSEVRPQISVLTGDQIERVHNFSLEILSTIGIRVDSTRAMSIFEKAGAKPAGDRIVRIPPELVQWALKAAPSTVDICNRIGDAKFQLGDPLTNDTRFGVGVTNLYYQDPANDGLIPFSREHMASSTRLGGALESFDFICTIGIVQDCPPEMADLIGTLEMVANTTKPLAVLVSKESCFSATLDLLEHLHGDLATRPFCIPYFNPITPLVLNQGTSDKMLETIRKQRMAWQAVDRKSTTEN